MHLHGMKEQRYTNNMDDISVYDAIGNSLDDINQRFQKFDIRLSLYDQQQAGLEAFFTSVQQNSAAFNNFYTQVSENSAFYKGASDLVYNLKDYWQNPVTLVYPKTFAVLAGYKDIENWLNTDFYDFGPNQMVRVNFFIKSYDDQLLSGTALEKFTTETLDALASPYGLKTVDIKRFIVLDNHVKAVIATTNNIISRIDKTLISKTHLDLNTLINSFVIKRQTISSTKINAPSETLLLIWSFLQQYQIIQDEYQTLFDLQISSLPSNVLTKFNDKNIFNSFVGSFCFVKDRVWKYVPSCQRDICINTYCDDCYDPVDVNKLYDGTDCSLVAKYVLYECQDATKADTKHVFTESQLFTIPQGAETMRVKCWGSKGGDDHSPVAPGDPIAYGGGGGYTYAEFDVVEGTTYNIQVDEFGGTGIFDIVSPAGGLAGVFLGGTPLIKTSYNRALIIAGGGSSAVADEDALPAGMFLNGRPGNEAEPTGGGRPDMQGINGTGIANANNERASGGGGYRGGTHLKGGTGYVNSTGTAASIVAGSGRFTANTGDPDYLLLNGHNGGVVIEITYATNYILS